MIEKIRAGLPELPNAKKARFMKDFCLPENDANLLISRPEISDWFEAAIDSKPMRAKPIANWMISELFAHFADISDSTISPEDLRELVDLIMDDTISGKIAKDVFAKMLGGEGRPSIIIEKHGLRQVTDTAEIEKAIDEVIAANPGQVAEYKGGKTGVIGWLVGQVMKKSGGRANPGIVNKIMADKLA
jgi:aspartyl-tRNA(Asn)/glutamyl-tRNA(Gln) amidotransferase subunit B